MTIIRIDKPVKASEIKKTFNTRFPFLKIEFFKKTHIVLQGSSKKYVIIDDFTINSKQENEIIIFSDDMIVSELEKQFADKLKLSTQIFRKSGKTWIETTFTDSWTLKKQNQEGMELSQL